MREKLKEDPNDVSAPKLARTFAEQGTGRSGIEQIELLMNMAEQPRRRCGMAWSAAAWQKKIPEGCRAERKLLQRLVQESPQSPQRLPRKGSYSDGTGLKIQR